MAVPVSAVFRNPGDTTPLKPKYQLDRVRLLDLPLAHTPPGDFQAVVLPADRITGYGWMPANDLTPTSCAGLP